MGHTAEDDDLDISRAIQAAAEDCDKPNRILVRTAATVV